MLRRKSRKPANTSAQQLQYEEWFQTPLGQQLLTSEREAIHRAIKGFYGYHLLEIPVSHRMPVGRGSLVRHHITAISSWHKEMAEGTLIAQPHELPFDSDCMDVVVLHHTLDFAEHPHQLLREAARVLMSGGHLVIVGFNPYSLWGARKLLGSAKQAPWSGRFLSPVRLEDWLALLDFRVKECHFDFYQPPLKNLGWLQAFNFLNRWGHRARLPTGAYYTLVAQKRVAAVISMKPKWRRIVNVGTMPAVNRVSREQKNECC